MLLQALGKTFILHGSSNCGACAAVLMLGQQRHAGKGFVAPFAAVPLHICVCLEVSAEVGPVGKRSAAVVAPERLLPRVGSDVALKQPRAGKGFAADVTLAG